MAREAELLGASQSGQDVGSSDAQAGVLAPALIETVDCTRQERVPASPGSVSTNPLSSSPHSGLLEIVGVYEDAPLYGQRPSYFGIGLGPPHQRARASTIVSTAVQD